jgi:sterol desaturase/sphingolipid hydroxylase (fatty acid hydroxylase superfamily)
MEDSTTVRFASDARREMFKGLEVAAKAVGATLGPRGRCVVMAGGAYALFWKILPERFRARRIQKDLPRKGHIKSEILYSISTSVIFSFVGLFLGYGKYKGWFQIYTDFDSRGWLYFFGSLFIALLLHDAYFYFAHRLMHTRFLFKHVHRVHHESTNPTPWAAFSFHPYEAVLEALVLPLILVFVPMHVYAVLLFMFSMTALNVLGHLGYELYPKGFTQSKWTFWNNTSTHHNMHHRYVHCNYGLYFNWWDRAFKTNHARYHERYEDITAR